MPRVLYVPATGAWSFTVSSLPFTLVLPASAKAGVVTFAMVTTQVGSNPLDPQGAIGHLVVDGGAPTDTACINNGTEDIPVPALATTLTVSVTKGCTGGVDETFVTVSGVGA